jgi:hypothetical protein
MQIKLTQGRYATVDDTDFEWVNKWRWSYAKNGYAVRHEQKSEYGENPRRMIKMHRLIMKVPKDIYLDHINGNRLDNRRSNLRIATNSQNQANALVNSKNTSGYKGVCLYNLDKPFNVQKPWGARITVMGKKIFKGMFATKEEAAKAYNELAKKYHGEYARLNMIGGGV